jgi:ribonuclease HI
MTNKFSGAVIYTDGSAKPNPGYTGWGVHGYFYQKLPSDKKIIIAKHHIGTSYGYIHQNEIGQNPRAVPVNPILYIDGFGSGDTVGSNNAAEIDALYYSLVKINSDFIIDSLQVFTDSEYLRKGIVEWRALWEINDFKRQDGTDLSNKDKWIRLFKEIDLLLSKDVNFSVDWVKGHNDIYGNVVADRLATLATIYTTNHEQRIEFNITPHKDYWKVEIDRHPFLDFSRLYFNSQSKYNITGNYLLADPGKDELMIGKRIPDTSYCVLKINNGDPVIETIKKKQFEVSNDLNSIMLLRLDRVYQPDVYKYISMYGDKVLYPCGKNNVSLNFIDQKPITVEMNPTGLSIRAIEALVFLEDLLNRYIELRKNPDQNTERILSLEDITHFFYERVRDKKNREVMRLKSIIDQNLELIKIPIQIIDAQGKIIEKKVPIVLGSDILKRNGLKKIENMNPMITLLTWRESATSLRYATVIQTHDATGIWSNFYADRLFF